MANSSDYSNIVINNSDIENSTKLNVYSVYLIIPTIWIPIYRKLLVMVSDAGNSILQDCSYGCKGDGSIVFNCWNIFQSACAAYSLEDFKKATFYINYVEKQIDKYNATHKLHVNDTTYNYTITPDGEVKVEGTTIKDNTTFYASEATYKKYQEWLENQGNDELYWGEEIH